jgi:ArsR family transcriptional regulator
MNKTKNSRETTMPDAQTAEVFKAIGHPTRLGIVKALAERERCVNEIAEATGADVSTVSLHLTRLRHAGVVEREQRGKHVFYRLSSPQMAGMLRCISSGHCCGGCDIAVPSL